MKDILIVEDDPRWTKIIDSRCRKSGFATRTASSPQLALDMIDEDLPALIFLDLLLATETGIALLNEMQSHEDLSEIPVVVCSAVGGLEPDALSSLGVDMVLDKTTMTPGDIDQAIKELA